MARLSTYCPCKDGHSTGTGAECICISYYIDSRNEEGA